MTKSNKYLTTVTNMFPVLANCLRYGSEYINGRRVRINNLFRRDFLNCCKCFRERNEHCHTSEFLSTHLWFNMNIKVGAQLYTTRTGKIRTLFL